MALLWVLAAIAALLIMRGVHHRKWGFALAAVCATVLLWAMLRSDFGGVFRSSTGARPVQPAVAPKPRLPADTLEIQELRLTGTGAPWRFAGRLTNKSADYDITAVSFDLSRADCYEEAPTPDGCVVVWQAQRTINLAIPPRQTRDFSADIWLHGSPPRLRGTAKDQFNVVEVSGRSTEP